MILLLLLHHKHPKNILKSQHNLIKYVLLINKKLFASIITPLHCKRIIYKNKLNS